MGETDITERLNAVVHDLQSRIDESIETLKRLHANQAQPSDGAMNYPIAPRGGVKTKFTFWIKSSVKNISPSLERMIWSKEKYMLLFQL